MKRHSRLSHQFLQLFLSTALVIPSPVFAQELRDRNGSRAEVASQQGDTIDLAGLFFRDMVIYNHLDQAGASQRTIGIEVELAGLSAENAVKLLIASLGGEFAGEEKSGTEAALVIKDTAIGKIKIEPVNFRRLLNRYNETSGNQISQSQTVGNAVDAVDRQFGQIEIVTEPLNYRQVSTFAKAMDALSYEQGARGTSNLGRLISVQVNIGIDPKNSRMMTNLLHNYYANSDVIEKDIKPSRLRRGFLGDISPRFSELLRNRDWNPSVSELFDVYKTESPGKLAKLNLFNALIMNPENENRFEQPTTGKARIPRPVAEFREADTKVSDKSNPTLFSERLMRETNFAIAMVQAAEKGRRLSVETERKALASGFRSPNRMLGSGTEIQPLSRVIQDDYKKHIRTVPAEGSSLLLGNLELLRDWGVGSSLEDIRRNTVSRFGVSVSGNPQVEDVTINDISAPMATQHSDGAGGRGDGRAMTFMDMNGLVQNAKGTGLTPYVLQRHATWLGWHIGGVDGKASLSEGVRSYITGELLSSLRIDSERIGALIDNNSVSDSGQLEAKSSSAIIVRQLPGGGIRNSHLRSWDQIQIRRGLDYLKSIAQFETGHAQTDATFLALDASRAAQQAARLQDAYVVHGALTAGNVLAYPGVVDLNTVTFLDAPDMEFTPIAQRSRFGNQANRLMNLVVERRNAYAKANPSLKKVDSKGIFEAEFNRELSLLALERLGMDRAVAVEVFDSRPDLALNYSKALWQAQFKNLHTDFRGLVSAFAELSDREISNEAMQKILDENTRNPDKLLAARRPLLQKLANRWRGAYSELDAETAQKLKKMAGELMDAGYGRIAQGSSRTTSKAEFLRKARASAKALADRKLPTKDEVAQVVDAVVAEKQKSGKIEISMDMVSKLLSKSYVSTDLLDGEGNRRASPRSEKQTKDIGSGVACDKVW